MSVKNRLSSGVAQMFGGIWVEQAFAAVAMILIARQLGAEAFGVATMAMVIIVAGEVLVRETVSEFLIQRSELEDGHKDAVFWSVTAVALAIAGGVFFAAPAIAGLYGQAEVAPLLQVGALSILSVALAATPIALLRRELAFRTLAIRSGLGAAVGGVAGVTAALMGAGPWSLIVQRLAQALANDGLIWLVHPFWPRLRATSAHWRDVAAFSWRVLGVRATEVAAVHTPSAIIGVFVGPAALGYYAVAWRFVDTLVFLLTAPVRYVAQPAFAALKRGAGDPAHLLSEISEALSLVSFASLLGLAAIAEPLIVTFFGPDWLAAALPLQILCLVGMYYSIERLHFSFCLALGVTSTLFYVSLFETALSAAMMIAFSRFGLPAVALALAASLVIAWPLRLWVIKRLTHAPIAPYMASYLPPLLAAVLMAGAAHAAIQYFGNAAPLAAMAIAVGVGVTLYAALCWTLLRARVGRAWALAREARAQG
ncbi:MAG: oligosaccharide flippase family protein [Alphaproteobacteria bacterium]|nr:oligosaccharide flippase family protein [Alphaproteobacteria bacterium]